jgi:CTP synthase (UTP-ammonia lyase)
MTHCRIGLIGDYLPSVRAHQAIPHALALAADDLGLDCACEWVGTDTLDARSEETLAPYDGLWCVPNSPYRSMEGALLAIQWAREHAVVFLGTCGGFQHTLIEYARYVLGLRQADHAEVHPDAEVAVIAPLACSLVDTAGTIRLLPGTQVAAIYGCTEVVEGYHCSYGLDPRYRAQLEASTLRVSGVDQDDGVRVVELEGHPFYLATLYQPELSAFTGAWHPLVRAFVAAAAGLTPAEGVNR